MAGVWGDIYVPSFNPVTQMIQKPPPGIALGAGPLSQRRRRRRRGVYVSQRALSSLLRCGERPCLPDKGSVTQVVLNVDENIGGLDRSKTEERGKANQPLFSHLTCQAQITWVEKGLKTSFDFGSLYDSCV